MRGRDETGRIEPLDYLVRRLQERVSGDVLIDEPLSRYTHYRLGGPADVLVQPASVDDVVTVRRLALEHEIPVTVLGGGSNVLIADAGLRGIVLRIGRRMNAVKFADDTIEVECGAPYPRLGRMAVERGLAGLEFAAGVPGTVGGALAMNAGVHDATTADVVQSVTAVDSHGDVVTLGRDDMKFAYRTSRLQQQPGLIAVKATLRLLPASPKEVREKLRAYMERRRRTQPVGTKNAGSVFKNPPGDFAGRLVEAAGCKGLTVGDAIVSPMHANFIINRGEATADDVRRLIDKVQATVYERFGVRLEPEVRMLGFA